MAHPNNETSWINRLFTAVIDISVAAVAVHYAAPWNDAAQQK